MKNLNITYTEEDYDILAKRKEAMRIKLKFKRLAWDEFFMRATVRR